MLNFWNLKFWNVWNLEFHMWPNSPALFRWCGRFLRWWLERPLPPRRPLLPPSQDVTSLNQETVKNEKRKKKLPPPTRGWMDLPVVRRWWVSVRTERHTFHQSVTNWKCFSIKCFFPMEPTSLALPYFLLPGGKSARRRRGGGCLKTIQWFKWMSDSTDKSTTVLKY